MAVYERRRVVLEFKKPSRTHQSFKDECDVNRIMSKFEKTSLVDHVNRFQGSFLDVSSVPDYQTSLAIVASAQERFAALPSRLRSRFANDPAEFLAFVSDPRNAAELVELGLANPPAAPPASPAAASAAAPPSGGGAEGASAPAAAPKSGA